MRVYRLNEYDWVAAHSLEEAVAHYKEATGLGDEEDILDELFAPYEMTEEQMNRLKFVGDDGEIEGTFTQVFKRRIGRDLDEPYLFASTET